MSGKSPNGNPYGSSSEKKKAEDQNKLYGAAQKNINAIGGYGSGQSYNKGGSNSSSSSSYNNGKMNFESYSNSSKKK